MYLADTTVLSRDKYPEIFEQMEKDLRLSKNLYNAALFRHGIHEHLRRNVVLKFIIY